MATETTAREALHDPPFALYGVPGLHPREVQSFSYDGQNLSLAGLGHGTHEAPDDRWVGVVVTGPLRGVVNSPHLSGTWEERPETLASFHVVICNSPGIDGEQIPDAQAALEEQWKAVQLSVDGEQEEFELIRQGQHWGAVRHIEPDHAIVICASNMTPDEIELERVLDLEPYFADA
jgi:hypothetical protein